MDEGDAEEEFGAGWAGESLAYGEELLILYGLTSEARQLNQYDGARLQDFGLEKNECEEGVKTYSLLVNPFCLPADSVYESAMQDLEMDGWTAECLYKSELVLQVE